MMESPQKWCNHCQKVNHDDAECWSTRVVSEPWKPFMPSTGIPAEAPGFHKLPSHSYCFDSGHGIPSGLHIPAGMRYVHYCPTCKHKSEAIGLPA